MTWKGELTLSYHHDGVATRAMDRHDGPLRVLKALYPEGGVCHHVMVHPPGGVAGGDQLNIQIDVASHAHAVLTTPGATRFYRTKGDQASQSVKAMVHAHGRLEWFPLENIIYSGARVRNDQRFELHEEGSMMGWDFLSLGLPAGEEPWEHGIFEQHIEIPHLWLEQGTLRSDDALLLNSGLGLASRKVLACGWCVLPESSAAQVMPPLMEATRHLLSTSANFSATSPQTRLVVWRGLSDRAEPLFEMGARIRQVWREIAWQVSPCQPRIWKT